MSRINDILASRAKIMTRPVSSAAKLSTVCMQLTEREKKGFKAMLKRQKADSKKLKSPAMAQPKKRKDTTKVKNGVSKSNKYIVYKMRPGSNVGADIGPSILSPSTLRHLFPEKKTTKKPSSRKSSPSSSRKSSPSSSRKSSPASSRKSSPASSSRGSSPATSNRNFSNSGNLLNLNW